MQQQISPCKSQQAYDQLKALLINWQIVPGVPLHVNDLAESLSLGITPVREALIHLQAEGFLEEHVSRGFVFQPPRCDRLLEIYEATHILLLHCVKLILERDSEKAVSTLEGASPNQDILIATTATMPIIIERYYANIAACANNFSIEKFIRDYNGISHRLRTIDVEMNLDVIKQRDIAPVGWRGTYVTR